MKELAILAEELFFEPGVLDVSATDHGLSSFWTPPGTLDEEEIRRRREGATKGAPFLLAVARQEGPPADFHWMLLTLGDRTRWPHHEYSAA